MRIRSILRRLRLRLPELQAVDVDQDARDAFERRACLIEARLRALDLTGDVIADPHRRNADRVHR